VFHPARVLQRFGAGPSLAYHFAVASRATGAPEAGVLVEFHKTGGIAITPSSWSQVTDAAGRVVFASVAQEYGTLTGDLTIHAPAPWRTYTRSIQLTAFDGDTATIFGIYGVGAGVPYFVRIRNNGVPVKNAVVEFRRTSGVITTPNPARLVTNDTGVAFMSFAPAAEGEIVGDITVSPPSPLAGFTVRNVHLQAMDADPPGGWILLGDWDIESPPASALRRP
jgi:hypothetical protein